MSSIERVERVLLLASLILLTGLLGLLLGFALIRQYAGLSSMLVVLVAVVSVFFVASAVLVWMMGWVRVIRRWTSRAALENLILCTLMLALGPIAATYLIYHKR